MSTRSGSRGGSTSAARISRSPPGRRSVVTQHQARHLVQLVRLLERESPRLASAYRALSLEALVLAAPRLDDEQVRVLKNLLEDGAA